MHTAELFERQGYIHLKGFLDENNCKGITQEFMRLVDSGCTWKDSQCPLSQSIHSPPLFDSMLEQLLPYFEQFTGRKLHPTYSYARIYAPNDTLRVHTDREACEISATVTLGWDGKQWPIYMADAATDGQGVLYTTENGEETRLVNESEILMGIGDAVVYKGMEKYHWRNSFEGVWQAQVFLHYVDANGPNTEWIYDKRGKLTHHGLQRPG